MSEKPDPNYLDEDDESHQSLKNGYLRWRDLVDNPEQLASVLPSVLNCTVEVGRHSGEIKLLISSGNRNLLIIVHPLLTDTFDVYYYGTSHDKVYYIDMVSSKVSVDFLKQKLMLFAEA